MDEPKPKRTYKDSLFCSRFSNPEDLAALHELISGRPTAPSDITINTLKDALFSNMRNDISYLVGQKFMVLTEEQSSLNQNMPLRMLMYVAMLYRRMLKDTDFFKESYVPLPAPEFYELYCGTKEQPLISKLRLSNSFPSDIPYEPPLELVVTRFNIGYNEDITRCNKLHQYKPIRDYSFFVYDVQRRVKAGATLGDALADAMDYCIDHDIMKNYLIEHRQEVPIMYGIRWSEKLARQAALEEGEAIGEARGEAKGIKAAIAMAKSLSIGQPQVIEQLMKSFNLSHEQALEAVQANW